ncbi:S8 family serine peptidase [Cereibacter johrii]|uniref:S8 family serine peptidase n=1 Tax=Cereibacter johrii TaxID=445629 RepID=UPI002B25CFA7|nr:S8 family serine peptidase [Cereibacter johrii]MEA5160015.1 S8 family serine peptidase [Cereibacter johrii]
MRQKLLALVTAGTVALSAPTAAETVDITWRSTPADAVQQTREATRLYLALYNSGNLRTHSVPNPDGQFVEPLAFSEGALIGSGLPPALNALFCDLNRTICRRELRDVPIERFTNLADHVGGYEVSEPRWVFRRGAMIVLPDYRFDTFTTLRGIAVPSGWTPSDFEADAAIDCSKWGVSCGALVEGFNPPLFKQQGVAEATLPVAGYTTDIEIGFDRDSAYLPSLRTRTIKASAAPATAEWSSAYRTFAKKMPMTDLLLSALGRNVILVGDVDNFSVRDEPHYPDQKSLFELIAHPFALEEDLPASYRHPVPVLVLDAPFGEAHCDLPLTAGPVTGEGEGCAEIQTQPNPISDHAPHVLGIIGAPLNRKGIAGLNPFAQVTFKPINSSFSAEDDLIEAQTELQTAGLNGARVANLSWGFPNFQDDQDLFAFAVEALQRTTLVVAAAGNEGLDVSRNCNLIPACLNDLPNVITVVGLNRDIENPVLWTHDGQGSNRSQGFHVAAIAENVLSTVGHNKLGKMSGTSQAAPQVTAAASLIYSAAEDIYPELNAGGQRLAPKVVKDRLIYTSDLFRGLRNFVQGGRLNVERAILVNKAQFLVRDGEMKRRLVGRVVNVRTTAERDANSSALEDFVSCRDTSGPDIFHEWNTIRRMWWDGDRGRYSIYWHDAPTGSRDSREAPFRWVHDCNMNSLSTEVFVVTSDGQQESFSFGDILDYTSGMLE